MRNGWPLAIWLFGLLALQCDPAHSQAVVQASASPSGGEGMSPLPATASASQQDQPTLSDKIPPLRDFKKALLDRGLNFQLNYTGEVFGNATGGVRQRATYEGLLEMALDGDLNKIAGLPDASFHINAYQIHGDELSRCCVFNQLTISAIEARPSTRLFEAWFEQKFFSGMASIRIGQMGADTEFFISDFGALYINATFGWANILAADLPSTGPNYPLATPAVRLKVTPNDRITLLGALFNGDPAGAGFTGLQEILDPSGLNFRLRDPPLLITEGQYKYNLQINSQSLPGTAKLGAWYHFGNFNDRYFDTNGISLANPSSNGIPMTHAGDYQVYGIIDQMIWRTAEDDPKKGVGVFTRVFASPSDRNVADFYIDGGINFIGLWPKRPDDTFGLAVAYSPVSPYVSMLDSTRSFFQNRNTPVRDFEAALELTYQATVMPGLVIQPDFQYIFHPNYGAIDPVNPAVGRIRDAAVFGLHTALKF